MRLRIDAREDPRTLGLLRIGLGICLFGDIASLLPHAAYLYGDAGIAPAALVCGEPLRWLSLMCQLPGEGWSLAILGALEPARKLSVTSWAAPLGAKTYSG